MLQKLVTCRLGSTYYARYSLLKMTKTMNKELLQIPDYIMSFLTYVPLETSHCYRNGNMGKKIKAYVGGKLRRDAPEP